MVKKILAILAGLTAAMAVFLLFEQISHSFYPPPANLDYNDKTAMKNYIQVLPVGSLLLVLAGWLTGSFIAGFIIKLITRSPALNPPLLVSVILMASSILNMVMLPHPVWFIIAGVLIFLPAVFFGFFIRGPRASKTGYNENAR